MYSLPYQVCRSDLPCVVLRVICGLSGWDMFFPHYLIKGTTVGKKMDIKCVFWFSLQLLSETFLILRRIRRDISIRCCCQILVKLIFLFRFRIILQYQISWKSVQWEPSHSTRVGERADKKLFENFRTRQKWYRWMGGMRLVDGYGEWEIGLNVSADGLFGMLYESVSCPCYGNSYTAICVCDVFLAQLSGKFLYWYASDVCVVCTVPYRLCSVQHCKCKKSGNW